MAIYYVDGDIGDDGNLGTSEGGGNAWATIDHAMDNVAAGDVVYVKASADYAELATIDTPGDTTHPILFVGYSAVADRTDRGKVTVDAEDTRASCLADSLLSVGGYYVFENFKFVNAAGDGVDSSLHQLTFRNCEFNDNGTNGCDVGNGVMVESCIFSGNDGHGLVGGTTCTVAGCRFLSNASDGVRVEYGTIWGSVFYDTGGNAIDFLGANGWACTVLNCTIDGNANTTTGVSFPASYWGPYMLVNTIIYDCNTGVSGHNNGGGRFVGRNNLLHSNASGNYADGYETLVGEVTEAPSFTDESAQDYTLAKDSPAIAAGFDGYETGGVAQNAAIGAHELSGADAFTPFYPLHHALGES